MGGSGEYVFIDESGDPGFPGANPIYILAAAHMSEAVHRDITAHISSFRYFHGVNREFKDWGGLVKSPRTQQWRSLMGYLGACVGNGDVAITATWMNKAKYQANRGPYLQPGQTTLFRHFQIRLLLERHRARRQWGKDLDVVLDRWSMSQSQRVNLENYVKNNWNLQPIGNVTTVDSQYVEMVQVVDLLTRLARRIVEGKADAEEQAFATQVLHIHEIERGLFHQ
ncbi:MAG: DUF3800 domain-containing protein [Actinomycetota bacterium]